MHPVQTPLTVAGALLARPDRCLLTDEQLQTLAATFPSTAYLGQRPWNAEAVIEQARACWSGAGASVDPTFGELAEVDFEPALPSSMQTLSTLRFWLWLWPPGIRKTGTGNPSRAPSTTPTAGPSTPTVPTASGSTERA